MNQHSHLYTQFNNFKIYFLSSHFILFEILNCIDVILYFGIYFEYDTLLFYASTNIILYLFLSNNGLLDFFINNILKLLN